MYSNDSICFAYGCVVSRRTGECAHGLQDPTLSNILDFKLFIS